MMSKSSHNTPRFSNLQMIYDTSVRHLHVDNKKGKRKKSTSSSRIEDLHQTQIAQHQTKLDNDLICDEFLSVMSEGLNALAVTSLGGRRSVTLKIADGKLSWNSTGKGHEHVSISISSISYVEIGLPLRILKYYSSEEKSRALSIHYKSYPTSNTRSYTAVFLASSSLERDALVKTFSILLSKT